MSGFEIIYINLDESTERRLAIELRLKSSFNVNQFKRFNAARGDDRQSKITKSELGCFLSHQSVISSISEDVYTIIIEDDAVLSSNFKMIMDQLVIKLSELSSDWDVLFLTQVIDIGNVQAIYNLIKLKKEILKQYDIKKTIKIVNAGRYYVSSNAAYIVNPRFKNKMIQILEQNAVDHYPVPIDICFKQQIQMGRIRAWFTFPYLAGTVNNGNSTIQNKDKIKISMLMEHMQNLFFVDADHEKMMSELELQDPKVRDNIEAYLASLIIFQRIVA